MRLNPTPLPHSAAAHFPSRISPNTPSRSCPLQCILGVFAETLLVEGYGLNSTAPGIVTVVSSRASPAVSWALGSMLYEANGLPFSVAGAAAAAQDTSAAVTALAVTLALVVLGGAAIGVLVWRRWPAKLVPDLAYKTIHNPVNSQ